MRNKAMPTNLYKQVKGRQTYFLYRHPGTGSYVSLGKSQPEAWRAARILNARLLSTPTAEQLVARVLTPKSPLSTWIEKFRDEVLPARRNRKGRPLSEKTLQDYKGQLKRIIEALGTKDVARISRREIAEYLEPFPPTYRNRMRGLLHDLFVHAVANGYRDDNPVEGTLKSTEVVKRQRLTKEEYDTIHAAAEPWLQRAMTLALITLQRRGDLVKMTYEDVADERLHITQGKTGAKLRVALNSELRTAIGEGVGLMLDCTVERLSKGFAEVRNRACLPPENGSPATFHEIRALGARLLRDRGIDPQALLGHIDPQMTRTYLDRHEVQWVEVTLAAPP